MASFYFVYYKDGSSISFGPESIQSDYLFCDEDSGWCILADARIDYKKELIWSLEIDKKVAEEFSDSRLILSAYVKWGEACLEYLYGDFAFVIWHSGKNQIFIARDHFGCKPLYYIEHSDFLALSSQIIVFRDLPGFTIEIRDQYILDVICSIEKSDDKTAYKSINRLKPAHKIRYLESKLSEQCKYWDLIENEKYLGLSIDAACQALKERIEESIRQRSTVHCQIGIELSGGLDSSGIASVLVKQLGQTVPIYALNHALSSEGAARQSYLKSELEYSDVIANEFSSIRHFLVTEEDSTGSYEALINALDILVKPFMQTFAMNSDLLFHKAGELGVEVLFSGLGGDEGITNNGSGYFNELLKNGKHSILRDTIREIKVSQGGSFFWRLIKHYIFHYAPWIYFLKRTEWKRRRYPSFVLRKDLARKYRMKRRFFRNYVFPKNPDVRDIQHFRLMHPNIPGRVEETGLLAQQHGIEYRYPFLDVKLIEFFYSLPSEYKFRNGQGRYLFREAMKGILPDKVRLRTDKVGTTIPYVLARLLKDEEIFRDLIEEGKLNNRFHYVDYKKLLEMLDTFKKMGELKRWNFGPREFLSPMSILILQKWQREGKLDIGIKC